MKILIVHYSMKIYGGLEYHIETLKTLLERNGHEVRLFMYADEEEPLEALKKVANDFKPDIYHFHSLEKTAFILADYLYEQKKRLIFTAHGVALFCCYRGYMKFKDCKKCLSSAYYLAGVHGCKDIIGSLVMWYRQLTGKIYPKSALNFHKYIFVSHFVEDVFCTNRFFSKIDGTTIYNSLNLPEYEKIRKLNLPKKDYLLYFGRVAPEKGLKTLIKAIEGTGIELVIAGKGPLEDELKALGKPNVKFTGFLQKDELRKTVAQARMTILPSECDEALGYSIIESFALGTPCMGSDRGGIPELMDNGRGLTFRSFDAGDLREKLISVYDDDDKLSVMASRGLDFVNANCSEDTYYQRIMEVYNS
ncbi:MAG: glycosyltransferase family 4 protein [bacterium]|nr:glycosyltransferase family 4 protein [bacterium]